VKRNDWERREQVALFRWAAMHPDTALRMLFAVPNGMAAKSPITVRKMKAEGLRPGVPDVWLPVPKQSRCGLVLEMKVPPNKMSPAQQQWADDLKAQGWYVVAPCWGFEHARDMIVCYLTNTLPPNGPEDYKKQLQKRYERLI
jgi:hypothetical protein